MEAETTIVQEAEREMDEMLAAVMPEKWIGHARLEIAASDLSDKEAELALVHTRNILHENQDKDWGAEAVAERVMEKLL